MVVDAQVVVFSSFAGDFFLLLSASISKGYLQFWLYIYCRFAILWAIFEWIAYDLVANVILRRTNVPSLWFCQFSQRIYLRYIYVFRFVSLKSSATLMVCRKVRRPHTHLHFMCVVYRVSGAVEMWWRLCLFSLNIYGEKFGSSQIESTRTHSRSNQK